MTLCALYHVADYLLLSVLLWCPDIDVPRRIAALVSVPKHPELIGATASLIYLLAPHLKPLGVGQGEFHAALFGVRLVNRVFVLNLVGHHITPAAISLRLSMFRASSTITSLVSLSAGSLGLIHTACPV